MKCWTPGVNLQIARIFCLHVSLGFEATVKSATKHWKWTPFWQQKWQPCIKSPHPQQVHYILPTSSRGMFPVVVSKPGRERHSMTQSGYGYVLLKHNPEELLFWVASPCVWVEQLVPVLKCGLLECSCIGSGIALAVVSWVGKDAVAVAGDEWVLVSGRWTPRAAEASSESAGAGLRRNWYCCRRCWCSHRYWVCWGS